MKSKRNGRWVRLIVFAAVVMGCSNDEGKSDLSKCLDGCTKAYEECGETYTTWMEENGQIVDEDTLNELQLECETECQDDADDASGNQSAVNCVINNLSADCRTLYSRFNSALTAYQNCLFDCEMALDCETFLFGEEDVCESDCEDRHEAYVNAAAEFNYTCENELGYAYYECGFYDYYDDECAPGCPDDYLGDGMCDDECNNPECGYDNGDCDGSGSDDCAEGCPDEWLGDGSCDEACNNAYCNYDNGDCY